jgi:hypothetical protein
MSIVTDFAIAMHSQAAAMIGAETVTIGETSLSCVLAEVDNSREFGNAGFEPQKTLAATCRTSALPVASLLQKSATARGESFRVTGVNQGGTFTTLTLTQITKA